MFYALLADAMLVLHLGFILFVMFGGLLVLGRNLYLWLHLPCLTWGIAIEFFSLSCPLTGWEIALRQQAGQLGYQQRFIEHYLLPVIYPDNLGPDLQFALAIGLIVLNILIYVAVLIYRHGRRSSP